MKSNNILSADLPEIDESVKECVNQGQWLLFKSRTQVGADAAFFLKAGSAVFGLNARGTVLEQIEKTQDGLEIDELFYFSDLPKPDSLSNAPLSDD